MSKRANGEGTISKRKDGRWQGMVTLGRDSSGKRVRRTVYGKTQQECRDKLDTLRRQVGRNLDWKQQSDSVAKYLQGWLESTIKPNKAALTYEEYELTVRVHITPYIGKLKLAKLNASDLDRWQGKMIAAGKSNNTRMRSIRVLRNALNRAMRARIIEFNPVSGIDKPKVQRRDVAALEPDQCRRLIAQCESHRLGDIVTVAVMTGLRLGELLALQWSDLNLSEGVLSVRRTLEERKDGKAFKEPKSRAGRRAVSLDDTAIQAFKSRRRKAIAEGMKPEHIALVFPNTDGKWQSRGELSRQTWYPIRKAADIPETVRFHDLRHTHASLAIAAGVHLKIVQERLGHSTFQLTADTYSHLLKGADADAAERIGGLVAVNSCCQNDLKPETVESEST